MSDQYQAAVVFIDTSEGANQYAIWLFAINPLTIYVVRADTPRIAMNVFMQEVIGAMRDHPEMAWAAVKIGGFPVYWCDYPYTRDKPYSFMWVMATSYEKASHGLN